MDDHKRLLVNTFDAVADGYDCGPLRFFSASANHMASLLGLRGDEDVLDVACGTGHASLAMASRLPAGHVTGVDFSTGMLEQARRKVAAADLGRIEFVDGDMQLLPWARRFDAAVCAFGIFFVPDMEAQLRHIASTVKPGGKVMTTCFAADYMEPLRSMMINRLAGYGVPSPPQTWKRVGHAQGCRHLFDQARLRDAQVERKQLGYFLVSPEDWWQIVWNAGFRRMVSGLDPTLQARFRDEHLAEVDTVRASEGIWLDIGVLFTWGVVAD